jgi:hypothetical protein
MSMHLQHHPRISLYDNEVPSFAEMELERLYGTIFSSLAHFRIYGGAENASTYVVRSGEEIITLLLFVRDKNKVRVINEWIKVGAEELEQFASYIFATFKSVSIITFHAVLPDVGTFARPCQTLTCGENIRVALPGDVETYVARLGSATRKNIKRHKNKLQRTFPSFCFRTYIGDEADERHLRDIIRFNHERMAGKGMVSTIDEQKTQALIRMVRERGFVAVATIDGRVCAGSITLRIGGSCVSRVNAHDPAYDNHRLGMICCFLTICEAIKDGAKHFDFLWGQYEYKTALLGVHHDLYDLVVYRSPLHQALNSDLALKIATINRLQKIKHRMLDMARPGSIVSPGLVHGCIGFARAAKRFSARLNALRHSGADG